MSPGLRQTKVDMDEIQFRLVPLRREYAAFIVNSGTLDMGLQRTANHHLS
jgi:hypothetical protein